MKSTASRTSALVFALGAQGVDAGKADAEEHRVIVGLQSASSVRSRPSAAPVSTVMPPICSSQSTSACAKSPGVL